MNGSNKKNLKLPIFRKETIAYKTDHILDNIDIKAAIEKNKIITKIKEDLFIYKRKKDELQKSSSFKNIINWKEVLFELENLKEVPATDYYCDFLPIGAGAFGTVYSAIDKKNFLKVAIKVIILI